MYSSGYAKYSPPAKKAMQYHSKGKSCGYYMRIIFFFSSLIQSLIIISLVLFLIYGKKQDSASTSRIQDLEESFSRLSIENVNLRLQRKNLTTLLNSTVTEKALIEWNLAKCRYYGNISLMLMPGLEKKSQQCMTELFMCKAMIRTTGPCPPSPVNCDCGPLANELKARLALVEANFTQTTQWMRTEKDQITRERDNLHLEVIRLRRDKITHEREVQMYRQRCKEDFVLSLSGVSNVTRAFLEKIDSLFPNHLAFQLTCTRQREHLDQIRNNCTSLSREVEEKFQRYLNDVGLQVSNILSESSRLKAENQRLYEDYRWCSHNRTEMIQQHRRDQDLLLQMHDEKKAKILEEKLRLSGDIDVLNSNINYKNKEVEHLKDQLKQLNMSCMARAGTFSGLPNSRTGTSAWGSSSSGSVDLGRAGLGLNLGSSASAYNKPASTGTGSSLFGGGSSSSMGSAFNKPASTGTGSSLFGGGSSSSTGSAYGRPASTGTGSSSSSIFGGGSSSSTGSAFSKPAFTGTGSSSSSIFGGGSSSSTGSAYSKPASTGTGSSSSSIFGGGSSSSTGSAYSKPASTGTGSSSSSLFGGGSSSSTGSAVNKPASTGTGSSSSSFSGASSSSTGSGLNRFGSTGTGSSSSSLFNSGSSSSTGSGLSKSGSTYGSAGSNPSSSGTGLNKPAQTGRGSSTSASSTGSAGSSSFFGSSSSSSNKPAPNAKPSTGFGSSSTSTAKGSSSSGFGSWLGFGNTNSGQSKTGSGTGKGPSNGNGFGGTGSSNGDGRTNGPAGGPVNVAQHLQDLQRFIYPPGPEEKQDLSRILG